MGSTMSGVDRKASGNLDRVLGVTSPLPKLSGNWEDVTRRGVHLDLGRCGRKSERVCMPGLSLNTRSRTPARLSAIRSLGPAALDTTLYRFGEGKMVTTAGNIGGSMVTTDITVEFLVGQLITSGDDYVQHERGFNPRGRCWRGIV